MGKLEGSGSGQLGGARTVDETPTQVDKLPRSPRAFQEAPLMFGPETNTLVFLKYKNQRTSAALKVTDV